MKKLITLLVGIVASIASVNAQNIDVRGICTITFQGKNGEQLVDTILNGYASLYGNKSLAKSEFERLKRERQAGYRNVTAKAQEHCTFNASGEWDFEGVEPGSIVIVVPYGNYMPKMFTIDSNKTFYPYEIIDSEGGIILGESVVSAHKKETNNNKSGISTDNGRNPSGFYRLESLSYDEGNYLEGPVLEQYKLCDPNVTLSFFVTSDEFEEGGDLKFSIQNNDKTPLLFTGQYANGRDGKARQVFDVKGDHFTLRWYNNSLQNNQYFPYEAFTNEHYSKKGISKAMNEVQKLLRMQLGKTNDDLCGVWRRCGGLNSSSLYAMEEMYKIYSEKTVLIMWAVNGDLLSMSAGCELRPYLNRSKEIICEGKTDCFIEWINKNTYKLYWYDESGIRYGELWTRCGLPSNFQKIFGTDIPIDIVNLEEGKILLNSQQSLTGLEIEHTNDMQTMFVTASEIKTELLPNTQTFVEEVVDEDIIFEVVEKEPHFPGDNGDGLVMTAWLNKNCKYPHSAVEYDAQGTACVGFVVGMDGSISDIKILKSSSDKALDNEAVRLVRAMPNWVPGTQQGEPVSVKYILPISYILRNPDEQGVHLQDDTDWEKEFQEQDGHLLQTMFVTARKIKTESIPNIQQFVEEVIEEDIIFEVVEKMPHFPGDNGDGEKMTKFFKKNLKYPKFAKKNNIEGTVWVSFIVGKDGSIFNVFVAEGVHELLDKEAVRVVQKMPNWVPGSQQGKPVSVKFTIPIKFSLK